MNEKELDLIEYIKSTKKEMLDATGVAPNSIVIGKNVLSNLKLSRGELEKQTGVKVKDTMFG